MTRYKVIESRILSKLEDYENDVKRIAYETSNIKMTYSAYDLYSEYLYGMFDMAFTLTDRQSSEFYDLNKLEKYVFSDFSNNYSQALAEYDCE